MATGYSPPTFEVMKTKDTSDETAEAGRVSGIQVIARAAAVLRALQHHPHGLSLGELAKLLDLPRSTVQRIVDALDQENLVIAASARRGVRLGPALIALGAATKFEIAEIARATLADISRATGETVDLSLLDGDKLVFVEQVSAEHQRLRAESGVGIAFPLHCTANGKAMLARLEPEVLEKLKKKLKLQRYTANTLTTWAELSRELDQVAHTGVAVDNEEHSEGICAVSASLRLPDGGLAAISVPVPTPRFQQQQERLSELLLQHCQRLQRKLSSG